MPAVVAEALSDRWLQMAFDPPRGSGAVLGTGMLRAEPEDFCVEEELGFRPAGIGQHVLLKIRKRNANTQWVARELARACPCRAAEVGYAGLKDRLAVAVQWFTVPASTRAPDAWTGFKALDFEVLEAHAHSRKLPRGALAANRFAIRVRQAGVDDQRLAERIEWIRRHGVPNYFGPQRFGRRGANLARVGAGLAALHPHERGFVLSAARSLIFNAVLAERVRDGTWERLEAGDLANLDARGSIFPIDEVDEALRQRCRELDIHPTGPMWGRGAPQSRERLLELEGRTAAGLSPAPELIEAAGMAQERRGLRLAVRDLDWAREDTSVMIRFRLTRGGFATTVLREIFEFGPAADEGDG